MNNMQVRGNLEKIIIASIIYDEDKFIELRSSDFTPDDFVTNVCKESYKIIQANFAKNIMPTPGIVEQEIMGLLHRRVKNNTIMMEQIGKFKEMLTKNEDSMDAFRLHLESFKEIKVKNQLMTILENAKKMADDGETRDVLNFIMEAYVSSFDERKEVSGINFYDLMRKNIDSYNPYMERLESDNVSKTGIYLIDTKYLNGGVAEGTMCIIAGRPGSGKTTLVKVIGLNNARAGKKTMFVSLEMSQEQIIQGYYAQTSRVEYGKILKNDLTTDEYNRLLQAVDREENNLKDFHIIESDSLTISQLINLLIRYKKQYGIEVFLLDYIQQIRLEDGTIPKNEQEYSMISELIRTIVKKLKLHAYVCAQVNRDCEKRPDKRPIASDLRSSGKLEQDAAYILTTYRDEHYNPLDSDHPTEIPNTMDISIVKNRFGPMGKVRTLFEGNYQNISNLLDGDMGD